MTNVTLAIDDQVLGEVSEIAARRQTTVRGLVRDHLQQVAQDERLAETRRRLVDLMENSTGRLGLDYKWDREALYEERMFPRHQHTGLRRAGKGG